MDIDDFEMRQDDLRSSEILESEVFQKCAELRKSPVDANLEKFGAIPYCRTSLPPKLIRLFEENSLFSQLSVGLISSWKQRCLHKEVV